LQFKFKVMQNFDDTLEKYIKEYEKTKKPIVVCFRDLIPTLTSDRATHQIHTYPAKLLAHIPFFFLNNTIFSNVYDTVLDSFCGSGTVLLESILAKRNTVGADSNPLARLISRTKTRIYDVGLLSHASAEILSKIDYRKKSPIPNVVNIDYWFLPHIKKQLSSIKSVISEIDNPEIQDFFSVSFSNLVKKVSLADPRVSVPVKLNPAKYPKSHVLRRQSKNILKELEQIDVRDRFGEIINQNIKRHEKLNTILSSESASINVTSTDARNLVYPNNRKVKKETIQLFISSPPYSGAQKYIRSSSLSLGWLGLTQNDELRTLDSLSIGRENFTKKNYKELLPTNIYDADLLLRRIHKIYPQRACIASTYLLEMRESFLEAVRVLKPNGFLILVAANNQICGEEFKTQEYLCSILESLGLVPVLKMIDDIKSYGLMTKRNKTASIITCEWVLVFKKVR
jgi:DNA modification methylase